MTIPNLVQAPMAAVSAIGQQLSVPTNASAGTAPRYGMTMWFKVIVTDPAGGTKDLGQWSSCQGLGVSLETEAVWAGGDHQAPYFRPKQISYPNITLERAMRKEHCDQVTAWLTLVAGKWIGGDEGGSAMVDGKSGGKASERPFRGTAVRVMLFSSLTGSATKRLVGQWKLRDAIPISWSAPTLNGSGGGVAIEKLVLMHRGFLDDAEQSSGGATGLNSQLQGKLTLSHGGQSLEFQYNPKEVGEERTTRFPEDKDSQSLKVNSDDVIYDRKKLTLSELDIEGMTAVKATCTMLWLWTELTPDGAPKYVQLRLGSNSKGLVFNEQVVIRTVKVSYKRFTSAGVPSRATVTLTLIVAEKKKPAKPLPPTPAGTR